MTEADVPYVLFSHWLRLSGRRGRDRGVMLWVCVNLIDHRAIGIGLSRELALDHMRQVTVALERGFGGLRDSGDAPPDQDAEDGAARRTGIRGSFTRPCGSGTDADAWEICP